MARPLRLEFAGALYYLTARGDHREKIYLDKEDRRTFLELFGKEILQQHCICFAYCLMDNHFVVVPRQDRSLARTFGEAHRRYTRRINFREGWRGHLWQERFHSYPMDERHLLAAVRYVERNPVAAGLVQRAEDWEWSRLITG